MKHIVFAVFLTVGSSMSCTDDDNKTLVCNTYKPIEDIDWLSEKVNDLGQLGSNDQWVSTTRHGPMTVFIFGNCCPNCLSVYPVYNCEGTRVGNVGDGEFATSLLDHDEIIWTSGCNF